MMLPRILRSLRMGGLLAGLLVPAAPPIARAAWDCGTCPAAPPPSATLYELGRRSEFQYGCMDPCACPFLARGGLEGTFVLVPYRSDPLFTEYLLCGIDWRLPAGASMSETHLTGEGWYRVGGEVAVQHQLSLCVSVNGGEIQRFESGLVPGGGSFPVIDISAATSGFFCYDSVLVVRASPASAGVPLDRTGTVGLSARPNPFAGSVDLTVFLARPSAVTLSVIDPLGREVRMLESGRLPAGHSARVWDGLRADGTRVPAGLYLVRLRSEGRELTRRIVRL
jgi:hypothetical protein